MLAPAAILAAAGVIAIAGGGLGGLGSLGQVFSGPTLPGASAHPSAARTRAAGAHVAAVRVPLLAATPATGAAVSGGGAARAPRTGGARAPVAGEPEPPAGTFATARHRPDGGRAAARAERGHDHRQPVTAALAELRAGTATGEAALREEQIEQNPTLAGRV